MFRKPAILGLMVTVFGLSVWCTWADEPKQAVLVSSETPAHMGSGGQAPKFEYVGSTKCKKCHLPEYKSWEKTKKGHALETLKPGQAKEAKELAKLDSTKDYSRDAQCVKCHTTGFSEKGGYTVPDSQNEAAVKASEKLAHVGCESCHGPGSGYLPIFEEITKSKRKYKVEELHAAGLTKIEKSTCTSCHNEQSPTFKEFDFEKMKEKRDQIHEKVELKQREK